MFRALVLIAASVAPAAAASAQPPALDPLSARLLEAHNRERIAFGLAPLAWDSTLAESAASYGPVLEALGRLQHSPRDQRPGQRENLWMGTRGAYSPEQMVGSWIAERRNFRSGVFPNVSATGNWADVAHYTTMMWPSTTRLGCAVRTTLRWDLLICRYSPPGNIDGKPLVLSRRGHQG